MHLADAFIQSDLLYCQYVCSLGIESTTFALLTQCSTTELQEHCGTIYVTSHYITLHEKTVLVSARTRKRHGFWQFPCMCSGVSDFLTRIETYSFVRGSFPVRSLMR